MMALASPEGKTWPEFGKLGAVIAQSLRQNAKAELDVHSAPNEGVRVTIFLLAKPPSQTHLVFQPARTHSVTSQGNCQLWVESGRQVWVERTYD